MAINALISGTMRPRSGRNTGGTYFLVLNFVFLIAVFLLALLGHASGHNPVLYLVLLVALLSSPLLFARSVTGPYMVLSISAPFFFVMFGMGDLVAYLSDASSVQVGRTDSILTYGEMGVLVAFLCLILGYAGAVGTLRFKSGRWFVAEWPAPTTLIVGLVFFTIGMIATFVFSVRFSMFQMHAPRMDALALNAIVLGRMVGELGEILLAYVLVRARSKAVIILILTLMVCKIPLGIVLNAKYIGISFVMAYLVVAWIYNKKIPWKGILVGGLAVALMFPLAYQYRAYMGKYYVSVGETLEDISGNLDKALSKEVAEQQKRGLIDSLLAGLESIAGRADMKPTVELIMARAGTDRPYQKGYTLTPLFYVLIPRFILPDKPDVPVGRLFNQEFNISTSPDTWISTTFIGELYWNFSWSGIVIGMFIIGYSLGAVGSLTNMDSRTNVVRILVVLITIATLVFKFQTGIAQQYSIFIRSLIIIMLLHVLFGRRKSKQAG